MLILKRHLSTLSFFWKFRHFIPNDKFNDKYTNYIPEITLDKIFKKIHNLNSVLDYGCATGEKLDYFIKKKNTKFIYGIDINLKALKIAKNRIHKKEKIIYCKFGHDLNEKSLKEFYLFANINKIDLINFARVLYILDDEKFNNIINLAQKNARYILIDDFFLNDKFLNKRHTIQGYRHSNFYKFLFKNFNLIYISYSPHKKKVLYANSKIALFKNRNIL